MKKMLALLVSALAFSSCTYGANRWNDFKDVVTVDFGTGLGVKGRISYIGTGLIVNKDRFGLREGNIGSWNGEETQSYETDLIFYRGGDFRTPLAPEVIERRKESYGNTGWVVWDMPTKEGMNWHWVSQVEASAGLGISARLGLNPLEAIDFILGFTTLDFYGDDTAISEDEKEEAEKAEKK